MGGTWVPPAPLYVPMLGQCQARPVASDQGCWQAVEIKSPVEKHGLKKWLGERSARRLPTQSVYLDGDRGVECFLGDTSGFSCSLLSRAIQKVFKIRPCVCGSSSGLTLELSICSVRGAKTWGRAGTLLCFCVTVWELLGNLLSVFSILLFI